MTPPSPPEAPPNVTVFVGLAEHDLPGLAIALGCGLLAFAAGLRFGTWACLAVLGCAFLVAGLVALTKDAVAGWVIAYHKGLSEGEEKG